MQGWGTLRFFFDNEEVTRTAKILSVAYLTHSAFFVTTDVVDLHTLLRYFVIGFYSLLVLHLVLETRRSVRIIERNENFARDNVFLEQFEESHALKKQLLGKHLRLALLYCLGILTCLSFIQFSPRNVLYAKQLTVGSDEYNQM